MVTPQARTPLVDTVRSAASKTKAPWGRGDERAGSGVALGNARQLRRWMSPRPAPAQTSALTVSRRCKHALAGQPVNHNTAIRDEAG
jgi:hypothetical protein